MKRGASDDIIRNCVQELWNQRVKICRIVTMGKAKSFEGAGSEGLDDFRLAVRRILASPFEVELPEAANKAVSSSLERDSLLAGTSRPIGKNDRLGRAETGKAAEVEVNPGSQVLIAPTVRIPPRPDSLLHHPGGRHTFQSAIRDYRLQRAGLL